MYLIKLRLNYSVNAVLQLISFFVGFLFYTNTFGPLLNKHASIIFVTEYFYIVVIGLQTVVILNKTFPPTDNLLMLYSNCRLHCTSSVKLL